MIQRLTASNNRAVWINTDQIVTMEVLIHVEAGYPSTKIFFAGGSNEDVMESPDDIMKFVNKSI